MQLRRLQQDGVIEPGRHIVPGAWFVADTRDGEMEGSFSARADTLLQFRFDMRRPGRWLSFNFALEGAPMGSDQVLGLIVETSAPTPVPFRFSIRSGQGDSFTDVTFAESHVAGPVRRTQVSLLNIRDAPALQEAAPWRNLRMSFTPASFELCLHDARFFVASAGASGSAARGAGPDLVTSAG